jgi:VWFA-related protein
MRPPTHLGPSLRPILCLGLALALTPLPAAAAAAEPGGSPPGETFGETVEVHVVNVEVQVTDRDGRRVTDLGPGDFELLEDGRPVEISQFFAAETPHPAAGAAAETAGGAAEALDAAVAAPQARPVHLVLFLDRSRLQPATRKRLVEGIGEFLSRFGSERQPPPVEVLLVAHGGAVRLTSRLDRLGPELAQALEEAATGFSTRIDLESERRALVNEIARTAQELREGERSALRFGDEGAFGLSAATARRDRTVTLLRTHVQQAQHQVRSTVATLDGLVRALAGLPGRKALLYVGEGLTLSPGADLLLAAERLLRLPEFELARLASDFQNLALENRREYEALGRLANAHAVTFYTLSAAESAANLVGGTEMNLSGEESGIAASLAGGATLRGDFREQVVSDVKEAACLLSGATGGLCQVDGAPAQLMEGAVEDFASVYSLGFVPAHHGDGEYHRLEVRVKRPGLAVRHRRGYLDRPREDRLRDRMVTALVFGAEDNSHGLSAATQGTIPGKGKEQKVLLKVSVPLDRLVLLPRPGEGTLLLQARILLLTQAPNGELGEVQEIPIRREIAETELPADRSVLYANTVQLPLPEGTWKVAVGLWDENGQTGSFLPGVVKVGERAAQTGGPSR